jgi:molecular chaperone Hsp33
MGRLIRGLAAGGNLRVLAADTQAVVEEARRRHGLSPTASAALGRAMTGALLITFLLSKTPRERISLRFKGDGELGGPVVEAGPDGFTRGYVKNPSLELPLRGDGKINVGQAVGAGELQVSRSLSNGEIYDSTVRLVSGEIAEDLAHYLWQSEQIPSAVLLGVRLNSDASIKVAGGVTIQVLPGAPEGVVAHLEARIQALPSFSQLLDERGLEGAVETMLEGLAYEATDLSVVGYQEGYIPLAFGCRCSRERALASLVYFDRFEREQMIADQGGAEVVCHWCATRYALSPEEIRSIGLGEHRCPDCGELWAHRRADGLEVVHDGELCSCGRRVELQNLPKA